MSMDDFLRDMNAPNKGRGTFTLEIPALGRTFIYDVHEDDGDLFYTPDPSNPDAPTIAPRSASRPPPTAEEVIGAELPPAANVVVPNQPPGPLSGKKPGPRRRGRKPGAYEEARVLPASFGKADPTVTPLAFGPPAGDRVPETAEQRNARLRARRERRLARAGIDPALPPPPKKRPLLPPKPLRPVGPNGRRHGEYGQCVTCNDGVNRNMGECWAMYFQMNELLPTKDKLTDEQIGRGMARLFQRRGHFLAREKAVTMHRNLYNKGKLKCQPIPHAPPDILSRKYARDPARPDRVLVVNVYGNELAFQLHSDPPECPPRPLLRQPGRKAYERFFAEWQEEEKIRAALPAAAQREARRLLLETHIAKSQQPPPPTGRYEEA